MSDLLDAITGVPNACEPLAGLVAGGQPQPLHLAALKRAGCEVLLDIRETMEQQPVRVPDDIEAAGLEYINIPVGHSRGSDATLARIRETVKQLVDGKRKAFFYCNSGNRVGATLIPYLMLDVKLKEEEAVNTAMKCGMRSAELMEWALEYVKRHRGSEA
jgi:rhodanese-related sulfurtransferase